MTKLKKRAGFTLIEVITALFIIGLLTLLILPNVNRVRDMANKKQAETMVQTIQGQVDLYEVEHPNEKPITTVKLLGAKYVNDRQVDRMKQLNITIDAEGTVKSGKK
ncbi:MAG: prepilin-type N-terminal cleavage/methylation domain-containing protein [Lactobacillaceae bacterium]|jgi:competence protein ComGC|nr:prepilin-type N-terminal cleavage/methylation domain-containing protein [Lactobacillaceae bacterium]